MPRIAIFLRGVNVGRVNRVPMADFRKVLEQLGMSEVRTLLNSGNAVATAGSGTSQNHAKRIRETLAKKLKVDVPVIVKTSSELSAIENENTLAKTAKELSRLLVAFADKSETLQELAELEELVRRPERFLLGEHAAYLWCANGILESKAAESLLGRKGKNLTTRNWATFQKIRRLIDS